MADLVWTVKVRQMGYDNRWRWTHGDVSYPDPQWWERKLWPSLSGARHNAGWWMAGDWEAKVVRVRRAARVKAEVR